MTLVSSEAYTYLFHGGHSYDHNTYGDGYQADANDIHDYGLQMNDHDVNHYGYHKRSTDAEPTNQAEAVVLCGNNANRL